MSGSSLITLNSSNVSNTQTNIFNYTFPSGSVNFKKSRIAVQSIVIPYSWLNVNDTVYNNAAAQLIFPVRISGSSTTSTINITIPNGFYIVTQLNQYLQSQMIADGYYLVNGSSQNVYYLEIVANIQLNNTQLNCYVVPTTLSGGYSYGATATWGAAGVGSFNTTGKVISFINHCFYFIEYIIFFYHQL